MLFNNEIGRTPLPEPAPPKGRIAPLFAAPLCPSGRLAGRPPTPVILFDVIEIAELFFKLIGTTADPTPDNGLIEVVVAVDVIAPVSLGFGVKSRPISVLGVCLSFC